MRLWPTRGWCAIVKKGIFEQIKIVSKNNFSLQYYLIGINNEGNVFSCLKIGSHSKDQVNFRE